MSASRLVTTRNASVSRRKKHAAVRANKVLAERNQEVVAVGAWVEGGRDFSDYPSALALVTEEIQAEKRRENEENLQRFQDEVRHRVARQAQVRKMRQQPTVDPDRRIPLQQHQVWSHHVSAGETLTSAGAAEHGAMERGRHESREGVRQGRLRLAACRMSHREEMESDLPGGEWNISPNRHNAGCLVQRAEQEVEEEDDHLLTSHHESPLVRQKLSRPVLQESEKSPPHPGLQSDLSLPRVLWPLTDPEEVKRQRQSQFLMHRRLCMSTEREQVKENKQHRRHLERTGRLKAEKEQLRLEEERKLERVRQLAEARQRLEQRELLILERLKLEEEEDERAAELRRRKREEKRKAASRFIEALRAQMKGRLSQEQRELPPLCYCATSFWDSHPDTCANNCVFHNNPKEYVKALHSTMLSLDLQ